MQTNAAGVNDAILSFVDGLQHLTGTDAILDAAMRELHRYGIETYLASSPRDARKRIDEVAFARRIPDHLTQLYSDWCDEYWDRNYTDEDPVVRRMRRDWKPFEWHELADESKHEPRALAIMERRMDAFDEGLVVPVFDLSGFAGFITITGPKLDLDVRSKAAIHLMAIYVFHHIRALNSIEKEIDEQTELSPREREVMTWVARGKTTWEISEILNISKRTVDAHALAACEKLRAVNRTQAVAVAIQERLIQL